MIAAGEYRVRLAARRDLHVLPIIERMAAARFREVGLDQAYGRCFISAEEFEARQHRGVLWVVANELGRPVGFATCSQIDDSAHLDEIDVLPQHGRRGVGSSLLRAVCAWARSRSFPAITLSTTRGVPWNEPFYRRRGFHELDESSYTTGIRRLRAAEDAAGLPVGNRLIMKRDLVSSRPPHGCGRTTIRRRETRGRCAIGSLVETAARG
ncbi:MAG TPA: GNAT family N-acetyltransferase [Candidatus Binatia bacterium]|nr:GNAT family N-acetyltransferase [Candidatus Binatia bacterium]